VVSLDLDVVVVSKDLEKITKLARTKGFKIEKHEHRLNFSSTGSDLRIQLQTDSRYRPFISRPTPKEILGYRMQVARKEDVLQGKVWAYIDALETIDRLSKRNQRLRLAVFLVGVGFGPRAKLIPKDSLGQV
jgi:hypothetical protein